MSKEEKTESNTKEKSDEVSVGKQDESKPELKPEVKETVGTIVEKSKPSTTATLSKADNIGTSTGTGLEVYNGFCGKCGARVANGIVKDGKVNCPTCKQDF